LIQLDLWYKDESGANDRFDAEIYAECGQ